MGPDSRNGRKNGRGRKTNRFDCQDWIKMCKSHDVQYEEWAMPRTCTVICCQYPQCGEAIDGQPVLMRLLHATTNPIQHGKRGDRPVKEETQPSATRRESEVGRRIPDGSAMGRVMKLQKRTHRRSKTPRRNGAADREEGGE